MDPLETPRCANPMNGRHVKHERRMPNHPLPFLSCPIPRTHAISDHRSICATDPTPLLEQIGPARKTVGVSVKKQFRAAKSLREIQGDGDRFARVPIAVRGHVMDLE